MVVAGEPFGQLVASHPEAVVLLGQHPGLLEHGQGAVEGGQGDRVAQAAVQVARRQRPPASDRARTTRRRAAVKRTSRRGGGGLLLSLPDRPPSLASPSYSNTENHSHPD